MDQFVEDEEEEVKVEIVVEELKALGNQLFNDKQYEQALAVYRNGLALLNVEPAQILLIGDRRTRKTSDIVTKRLSVERTTQAVLLYMNIAQALLNLYETTADFSQSLGAVMVRWRVSNPFLWTALIPRARLP
jgi:hypothetical protein